MSEQVKKYVDLDGLSHFKSKADAIYVAKETGKELMTSAEKTKLANIEAGAQVNVLEGVQLNGTTVTPTNKIANIQVNEYPTVDANKLAGIEAGAEVNVIEEIEINGVTATISGKKASATIQAGAIDSISVNGTPQTIDANKNVDITVPTKTSDLTNDDNVVKDASYVHTDNNFTTTLKNKLDGIDNGAEENVIETIKVNGTAQTVTSKEVDITVPTNNNQLTNGAGYQTANDVSSAIDAKISSAYKAKGSVAFANLPALSSSVEGFVYNVSNSFTTTADFVEGAGNEYPAGTNVVIIDVGSSTYKYDVLAGFIDLSNYVEDTDLVAITNAEIDTIFA